MEVPAGAELFANYGYFFDSAPPWYKSLFLRFMTDHPEEVGIIQMVSQGRTREQLEKAFNDYFVNDFMDEEINIVDKPGAMNL